VFLFILESIGTSELILIGIIALIFLGPRKLPQIARTIGKTMADFRHTTNEFKSTWEREVNFDEEAQALRTGDLPSTESTIARSDSIAPPPASTLSIPEIRSAQPDLFASPPVDADAESATEPAVAMEPEPSTDVASDKRTWL
jgi:Tat protein translocase TatB subunit